MRLSDSRSNAGGMPASLIGLLACGHCLAFIDRNLPAVAAPLWKADLGLSDAQLGLLDGPAFALLYICGMLASWPLAYSSHRVRLLAACVATWMLGMLIVALGHSFVLLVAGRALVGLGQSIFMPLALGLVVERAALQWRARSVAMLTASSVIGRSLSLLLGGATLALFAKWLPGRMPEQWRLLFVAMAVPNVLLMALLLRHAEQPQVSLPRPRHVLRMFLSAFRDQPWVMGAYLCGASASVLVVRTIGAWAPSVLHREQGLAPATAALVFGAMTLVAQPLGHFIAGTLIDNTLVNKRGEGRSPMVIVTGALLLAIPILGAMLWSTSPVSACAGLALASLVSSSAVVAALAGWPSMLSPSLRDVGLRVFLIVTAVAGEAFGPWMAGVVSDGLGLGGHGLSLALSRVCMMASVVGVAMALLASTGYRRAALEVAR